MNDDDSTRVIRWKEICDELALAFLLFFIVLVLVSVSPAQFPAPCNPYNHSIVYRISNRFYAKQ